VGSEMCIRDSLCILGGVLVINSDKIVTSLGMII